MFDPERITHSFGGLSPGPSYSACAGGDVRLWLPVFGPERITHDVGRLTDHHTLPVQEVLALLNDAYIIMEASEEVLLTQLPLPARGTAPLKLFQARR